MANISYDTVVLSGASVKGIITLGALQYMYDKHSLTNVKTYIGTSSGSLISYLLAIGYTPIEIMVFICTHQLLEKMQDVDIIKMLNGGGAVSFNYIQDEMEKMTIEKIGRLLTLKELYDVYGKKLMCITYNYTKEEEVILSMETHPDLPCLTAIRMSSTLPFMFERFEYMGEQYLDGVICNNFPIDIGEKEGDYILGIYVTHNQKKETEQDTGMKLLESIYKLLLQPISQACKYRIKNATDKCKIITLKNDKKFFQFSFNCITQKEKFDMFSYGYQTIKDYFEKDK